MQISDALRIHQSLSSFLAKRFFMFSDYAQRAIHRSLGMTPMSTIKKSEATMRDSVSFRSESSSELGTTRSKSSTLQQVNIMLPNICEALVLVTQCIVTVSLEAEEQQIRLENGESTYANYTDVKRYFNRKKYQESGLVESLIGTYNSTGILTDMLIVSFKIYSACSTSFYLALILANRSIETVHQRKSRQRMA